jgi:AraC-like DNA-binding protein
MLRFDQAGRGYHACREWRPRPDETPYIELLLQQGNVQPLIAAGERWRVVPDPSAHLLFVAWGDTPGSRTREPALLLVGARSKHCDVDVTGRSTMLGLRLRPGALCALVGSEARWLTDRSVPAEDVFGRAARELLERVTSGASPEAALRDAAAFVVERARARARHASDAALLAAALGRTSSIDEAARAAGLSPRAMHRRTLAGIGLAPKRVVRIRRLYRALASMLPPRSSSLSTAAAEAGYADQAHFSRDCAALLGESPTEFLSRGVRTVQDSIVASG